MLAFFVVKKTWQNFFSAIAFMVLYYKWGDFYGIFSKKTINKKGTYLQIYSSFYDPERGHTAHKAYKPIGYVHKLQAKGIDDPIAFYKEEVTKLNQELKAAKDAKKAKHISDDSPEKLIGYFLIKNINDKLSLKKYIDLMQTATDFRFNVFDMMSALVYARLVQPFSILNASGNSSPFVK